MIDSKIQTEEIFFIVEMNQKSYLNKCLKSAILKSKHV